MPAIHYAYHGPNNGWADFSMVHWNLLFLLICILNHSHCMTIISSKMHSIVLSNEPIINIDHLIKKIIIIRQFYILKYLKIFLLLIMQGCDFSCDQRISSFLTFLLLYKGIQKSWNSLPFSSCFSFGESVNHIRELWRCIFHMFLTGTLFMVVGRTGCTICMHH